MLRTNVQPQNAYDFVCIEDLVPQDHLLHKIHKYVDFSFILEKVKPYFCFDNGWPSTDPIVLFKMMFIGNLYGIRSERQLECEVPISGIPRKTKESTSKEKKQSNASLQI